MSIARSIRRARVSGFLAFSMASTCSRQCVSLSVCPHAHGLGLALRALQTFAGALTTRFSASRWSRTSRESPPSSPHHAIGPAQGRSGRTTRRRDRASTIVLRRVNPLSVTLTGARTLPNTVLGSNVMGMKHTGPSRTIVALKVVDVMPEPGVRPGPIARRRAPTPSTSYRTARADADGRRAGT